MTDIFIDVGESVLVNVGNSLEPDGTLIVDYEYNPSGLLVSGLENLSWDQYEQSTRTLLVTKLEDLVMVKRTSIAESEIALLNPLLWYDFSNPATLFSDTAGTTLANVDQAVARINDKSTNGNNATQATLGKRGIRRSGYLDFPTASGAAAYNLTTALTTVRAVLYVTRWLNTTGNYRTIIGNTSLSEWIGGTQASGTLIDVTFSSLSVRNGDKYVNGTLTAGLLARYTSDTIHVLETTANTSFNLLASHRNNANRSFIGRIYELLVFNYVPTLAQRQLVESYLAAKYNLVPSLPNGHLDEQLLGFFPEEPEISLSIDPSSTVTNYQNPFAPLVFKPIG